MLKAPYGSTCKSAKSLGEVDRFICLRDYHFVNFSQKETKRKDEINTELNEIISYIKTPEGQEFVVKLNKEDGR